MNYFPIFRATVSFLVYGILAAICFVAMTAHADTVGPDSFGYVAIDSNSPGGPSFFWIDVSDTGARVRFLDADTLPADNANPDDGVAPNISLANLNAGQGFPFYGNFRRLLHMSSNGALNFVLDGDSDRLANHCPVPDSNPPNEAIYVLWDDLVSQNAPGASSGGYVDTFSACPNTEGGTGACTIAQWENVTHFGLSGQPFDFQAVLYENGNILMNYPSGNPERGAGSTTGIESAGATDALLYACNTAQSLEDNFSILFRYPSPQVDASGQCVEGQGDCFFSALAPRACAGVNGFLGQINIASVINLQPGKLRATLQLFDSAGTLRGEVSSTLDPNLKQDFIINDLGLQPDSVGTVCVTTDASMAGAWTGGVTLYKPDVRQGAPAFGEAFDFALYYPFQNPYAGTTFVPLNTFHLGTDPAAVIANWISIADGVPGDARGLRGRLDYIDAAGKVLRTDHVNLPDGGRFDYSGHDGLTGGTQQDAVGMARFQPQNSGSYYLTMTRYFYDCPGASCNNFLAAFNIPRRPGTGDQLGGGVSTVKDEIAVLELTNTAATASRAQVEVFDSSGSQSGTQTVGVPALGTVHLVMNESGNAGFVAPNEAAVSIVDASRGAVSALSIFYKLDPAGRLEYAYAAPFVGSPGVAQLSQFNSFIQHSNELELYNLSGTSRRVTVDYVDYQGQPVFDTIVDLPSRSVRRLSAPVPENSYGTVLVQSSGSGIAARSYVSRNSRYTLSFPGQ